jgi:ATP-dependent Zn protease
MSFQNKGLRMSNDPPLIISLLVNWAPFLMLIAVWIFFIRRYSPRRGELKNSQYLALCLDEQKRHNQALEKILDRIVPASARNDITASSPNQQ